MNYRAKHVDTDKAIEYIEYLIKKVLYRSNIQKAENRRILRRFTKGT